MLSLDALIKKRQLKFYRRFKEGVRSKRLQVFESLSREANMTKFMEHYISLDERFPDIDEIYQTSILNLKESIRRKAENNQYKFNIYLQFNPDLIHSPFLSSSKANNITRFRCGSHYLPIETGRWSGINREERLCPTCLVLGDEVHYLFDCNEFPRLIEQQELQNVWSDENIYDYFDILGKSRYLQLRHT